MTLLFQELTMWFFLRTRVSIGNKMNLTVAQSMLLLLDIPTPKRLHKKEWGEMPLWPREIEKFFSTHSFLSPRFDF